MKKIILTAALIILLLIPFAQNVSACDWASPNHFTYTIEDETRTLYFRRFRDNTEYRNWLERNIWDLSDEQIQLWDSRYGWGYSTAFVICNVESQILFFVPDLFLGMKMNDFYTSHDLYYFVIHTQNPGQNCNTRITFYAHGEQICSYQRSDFIDNHASGRHGGGHLCDWRWDFYWHIYDQCNDTLAITLKTDEGRVIFFNMTTGDVVGEDTWFPSLGYCIPPCCCDDYYHDYHYGCCGNCVNFTGIMLFVALIYGVPIAIVISSAIVLTILLFRKKKPKRESQN